MTKDNDLRCDDAQLQNLTEQASRDSAAGISSIDLMLANYPQDPRLHFLKGSLLISEQRFIAAHAALRRAVALDPEFLLARFQLGFFELTSGEAEAALETWQPLGGLPAGHYLRMFASGLDHLVSDRFAECIAELRAGIETNTENAPLNGDMQLIISRCETILAGSGGGNASLDEPVSATSLLLNTARRPKR